MHESVLGRVVCNGKFSKQLKVSTLCRWLSNLQCRYRMGLQAATGSMNKKVFLVMYENIKKTILMGKDE